MYKKEFKNKLTIEIIRNFSKDKDFKQNCYFALKKLKIKSSHWNRIIAYHYPNELKDLLECLSDTIFLKLSKKSKLFSSELRVSEKIKGLLLERLKIFDEFKLKSNDLFFFLRQPKNLLISKKLLFKISDEIWHLAGDKSLDFNYYSKRLILMKIYFSSFKFWIRDDSDKKINSKKYIDQQFLMTSKIGKYKYKIKKYFSSLKK